MDQTHPSPPLLTPLGRKPPTSGKPTPPSRPPHPGGSGLEEEDFSRQRALGGGGGGFWGCGLRVSARVLLGWRWGLPLPVWWISGRVVGVCECVYTRVQQIPVSRGGSFPSSLLFPAPGTLGRVWTRGGGVLDTAGEALECHTHRHTHTLAHSQRNTCAVTHTPTTPSQEDPHRAPMKVLGRALQAQAALHGSPAQ